MALFTAETAREMARRSHLPTSARNRPKPEPEPAAVVEPLPQESPQPADKFTQERLATVRDQLKRLDEMMLSETNAQQLSWLATASMRLNDQEFALANRPKPGNYKPTAQKQAKRAYTQIPQGWQPPPPAAPPSEFS